MFQAHRICDACFFMYFLGKLRYYNSAFTLELHKMGHEESFLYSDKETLQDQEKFSSLSTLGDEKYFDTPEDPRTLAIVENLEKMEEDRERIQLRREEIGLQPEREKLSEVSAENIRRFRDQFIQVAQEKGLFSSEEEAVQAIQEEKDRIRENLGLTINLTPDSVQRFLERKKQDTLWDHLNEAGSLDKIRKAATTQGKDLHDEYIEYRDAAEQGMRQFVPDIPPDKKPVYTALAGGTNYDHRRGACPEYGNVFLELDVKELEKSCLNFNDSLFNVVVDKRGKHTFETTSILSIQDAEEAKSIVNLVRKYNSQFPTVGGMVRGGDLNRAMRIGEKGTGYVEAALFDEVTPEKVKSIGVNITNQNDLRAIGPLIDRFPEYAEKFTFFVDDAKALDPLTADWLEKHFPNRCNFVEKTPAEEAYTLWGALGISRDTSYKEVKAALDAKCAELWKGLKTRLGADIRSTARPENIRMIRQNQWRLEGDPKIKEAADLYTKLERGRLFFQ